MTRSPTVVSGVPRPFGRFAIAMAVTLWGVAPAVAAPPPATPAAHTAAAQPQTSPEGHLGGLPIAMMDFEVDVGADASVEQAAATTNALVAQRLTRLGVFSVLTQREVGQLVQYDQLQAALSEDDVDDDKLAALGERLGVQWLIAGSVHHPAPSQWTLSLRLFDTKARQVVQRSTATATSVPDLIRQLPFTTDQLVRALLQARSGSVLLSATEEGATLHVDGVAIGTSPLPLQKLAAGPHRIRATKDGFIANERDVVVKPDDTVAFDMVLLPSPETAAAHKRMAWMVRGTALAVGGAGIATSTAGLVLWTAQAIETGLGQDQGNLKTDDSGRLLLDDDAYTRVLWFRISGYVLMSLGAVVTVGGATAFLLSEPPEKYDLLAE